MAKIEWRRKWSAAEKAALLAEVEAEGGRIAFVARRHRMSGKRVWRPPTERVQAVGKCLC